MTDKIYKRTDCRRVAKKAGASMRGAKKAAQTKRAESERRYALIKDRWPLSSEDWPTEILLNEAGLSRNTVNALNGGKCREVLQGRYLSVQKRKERYHASR